MFPPYDEIRIRRCGEGYLTDLVRDGEAHSTLYDDSKGLHPTLSHLLRHLKSPLEASRPGDAATGTSQVQPGGRE